MPTASLIARLRAVDKEIWLPALSSGRQQRRLWFTRLAPGVRWRRNRFGIAEIAGGHRLRASRLDVLFLPLVGFDAHGYRLGMGGGFYDASLAHLHMLRVWRKPVRIGLAYAAQYVDAPLPHETWDVPLDAVLTEKGLFSLPLSVSAQAILRASAHLSPD